MSTACCKNLLMFCSHTTIIKVVYLIKINLYTTYIKIHKLKYLERKSSMRYNRSPTMKHNEADELHGIDANEKCFTT